MNTELATQHHLPSAEVVQQVLLGGDLSKLTPTQKVSYYRSICDSIGLNPLTKPFDYIRLNGREVLYAKRDATDQIRKIHGVSIERLERELIDDIYVVTAYAKDGTGRTDSSIGAVPISALKGEAKANAMMKAETKSKRRVTLSICGLGMLDETEIESITSPPASEPHRIGSGASTPPAATGSSASAAPAAAPSSKTPQDRPSVSDDTAGDAPAAAEPPLQPQQQSPASPTPAHDATKLSGKVTNTAWVPDKKGGYLEVSTTFGSYVTRDEGFKKIATELEGKDERVVIEFQTVPANGKRVRIIKDMYLDEPGAGADAEDDQEGLFEGKPIL